MEPLEVRLARIEEKIDHLLRENEPMRRVQNIHHEKLTRVERDRLWFFTMCVTAFSGAVYAVFEKIVGKL